MSGRIRCPICRAECVREGNPHRPFCSERCRMIDLSHWMGERYRIRGTAADESDNESEAEDE